MNRFLDVEPVEAVRRAYPLHELPKPDEHGMITVRASRLTRQVWSERPVVMIIVSVVDPDQRCRFTYWSLMLHGELFHHGIAYDPIYIGPDGIEALVRWGSRHPDGYPFGPVGPNPVIETLDHWRDEGMLHRLTARRRPSSKDGERRHDRHRCQDRHGDRHDGSADRHDDNNHRHDDNQDDDNQDNHDQDDDNQDDTDSAPETSALIAGWDIAWELSRISAGWGEARDNPDAGQYWNGCFSLWLTSGGDGARARVKPIGSGHSVLASIYGRARPIGVSQLALALGVPEAATGDPWSALPHLGLGHDEPRTGPLVLVNSADAEQVAAAAEDAFRFADATAGALFVAFRECDASRTAGRRASDTASRQIVERDSDTASRQIVERDSDTASRQSASGRPAGGVHLDPTRLISAGSPASALLASVRVMPLWSLPQLRCHPDRASAERSAGSESFVEMTDSTRLALSAAAASAYGGRGEANLVRVWHPAVLLDLASAYPVSGVLTGLSDLILAERWYLGHPLDEMRALWASDPLELADRFRRPDAWRALGCSFVRVRSKGAPFPVRQRLTGTDGAGRRSDRLSVAVRPVEGDGWWAAGDLLAARLRSEVEDLDVIDAVRFLPFGRSAGLRTVIGLGGSRLDPDDPAADIFAWAMLERQACRQRAERAASERGAGSPSVALWTARAARARNTANSLVGQTWRIDSDPLPKNVEFEAAMIDEGQELWVRLHRRERPGPHHAPMIAATITGTTRALMGLLEHEVIRAGGTLSQMLTDSALLVASPEGGDLPVPGARRGIRMLSWPQVEAIRGRFDGLVPDGITGHLLSAKHGTMADPERPVEGLVIATNRYLLARRNGGSAGLVHLSRHGLGGVYVARPGWDDDMLGALASADVRVAPDQTLADPSDPDIADLAASLAVTRFSVGSVEQLGWFPSREVAPFDRALAAVPAHLDLFGDGQGSPVTREVFHPDGIDPDDERLPWRHRHPPFATVELVTTGPDGLSYQDWGRFSGRSTPRVKTLGDVVGDWWMTVERSTERNQDDGPVVGFVARTGCRLTGCSTILREASEQQRRVLQQAAIDGDLPEVLPSAAEVERSWRLIVKAAKALHDDRVALRIPERSLRYYLDGRTPKSEVARDRFAAEVAAAAGFRLRDVGVNPPESRSGVLHAFLEHLGQHVCQRCGGSLPEGSRAGRRFCSDACQKGARRSAQQPPVPIQPTDDQHER